MAAEAADADLLAAGAAIGERRQLARPDHRHRRPRRPDRRVARRGRRPGLPRPAPLRLHPEGSSDPLMRDPAPVRGRPARRHPRRRRLPPQRVVPNSEVVDAIDSSDEWIQQRSGIKQRRWAAPEETVQMMSRRRVAARPSSEPASTPARSTRSSSPRSRHMLQTPASPPRSPTSSAPTRPPPSTSPPPAPASATASRSPTTWSAPAAPATSWSSASSGSPTSLDTADRGTAFIFADGAGAAVVGPSDTPGIGPVVWGSDGEQYDLIRQREDWRDVIASRRPADAAPRHAGQRRLPLGVVRHGQDRPAGPRPGRHHRRRPRRLRAPPGQHAHHRRDGAGDEAARHASRSRATSPSRATPRLPRSRSLSTG